MADDLHIFKETTGSPDYEPQNQISETVYPATMPNPDFIEGSGATGFVDEERLYLGNDGSTHQYDEIDLTALNDTANVDMKYAADLDPTGVSGTPDTYADSISYPSTYPFDPEGFTSRDGTVSHWIDPTMSVPFFRKLIVVSGLTPQRIKDMRHDLQSNEHEI